MFFDDFKLENLMISRMYRLEGEIQRFQEGIEQATRLIDAIQAEIN